MPGPRFGSMSSYANQAHIALSGPMTSIAQRGSSLGSCPTFLSPYPHFNRPPDYWPCVEPCLDRDIDKLRARARPSSSLIPTIIDLRVIDLMSNLDWWEAETNKAIIIWWCSLVGFVLPLWHIKHCCFFNTKSCFFIYKGAFNKFQTFLYRHLKLSWLLKIQYLFAIHLMRWLSNFYDFGFKWTATAGIGIHPTKVWLSQLVNFKNAMWTSGHFRRRICNKIMF